MRGEGRYRREDGNKRPSDQNAHGNGQFEPLTPREVEVVERIVEGQSDSAIATGLGIAKRTASKHVEHILAKLGVKSRTAAAVAWVSYLKSRPSGKS